jgi:hypothetical protein
MAFKNVYGLSADDEALVNYMKKTYKFRLNSFLPLGRQRISGIAQVQYYNDLWTPIVIVFGNGIYKNRNELRVRKYEPGYNYGGKEIKYSFRGTKHQPKQVPCWLITEFSSNDIEEFKSKVAEYYQKDAS